MKADRFLVEICQLRLAVVIAFETPVRKRVNSCSAYTHQYFTVLFGPVDKSKNSAEARSGPGRTVNLETEKDGFYHSLKV